MTENVSIRRGLPWKRIVLAALVVGAVLLGVVALLGWQKRRDQRAFLEEVARVYQTFRTCVVGEGVPDREVGRRIAWAEATGALDARRVNACRSSATKALEAIARDHDRSPESPFIVRDPTIDGDDRFGVCSDLVIGSPIIAEATGRKPDIDCNPHIESLAKVVTAGTAPLDRRWVDGDMLYIDTFENAVGSSPSVHHLQRSRDGVAWEELEGVTGDWNAYWSARGAWSLAFVPGDKTAHYLVLDGTTWRSGARARNGRQITWGRTDAGWTLVERTREGDIEVVWLDPLMQRVLGHQRVPELDKRYTWQAHDPVAHVDERGDAMLYRLAAAGQGVEIVAHPISPRGAGAPSTVPLSIDEPATDLALKACSTGAMTFLVVPTHAVVSSSASAPLAPVHSGGGLPSARAIACTGQRLAVASTSKLARCQASGCKVERIPLAAHLVKDRARIGLADDGRAVQLLIANQDRVYRFADGPDGTLALQDIWTWSDAISGGSVRLGDFWFLL